MSKGSKEEKPDNAKKIRLFTYYLPPTPAIAMFINANAFVVIEIQLIAQLLTRFRTIGLAITPSRRTIGAERIGMIPSVDLIVCYTDVHGMEPAIVPAGNKTIFIKIIVVEQKRFGAKLFTADCATHVLYLI